MKSWKDWIIHTAGEIEENIDQLRYRLRSHLGYTSPFQIIPYRGYGTRDSISFYGRVLEEKVISPATEQSGIWEHILNMYRRFDTDELPYARLRVRFGEQETLVSADEEGYFHAEFRSCGILHKEDLWHQAQVELVSPQSSGPVTAQARVLIPPPSARFGVISDIDDTVLWSGTTNILRMFQLVFLKNVRARLPFKGVPALYRALHCGVGGAERNPIFYVSSSPWNLYDLLTEFFSLYEIPEGPILLRDMGLTKETLFKSHDEHKLGYIRPILDTYPQLPFILLGDTSQRDPEIYRDIVRAYPERILAIYIRDVTSDPFRSRAIELLVKEVADAGSQLVLANDSKFAADHAAAAGWIPPGVLEEVQDEKRADEEADPVV